MLKEEAEEGIWFEGRRGREEKIYVCGSVDSLEEKKKQRKTISSQPGKGTLSWLPNYFSVGA